MSFDCTGLTAEEFRSLNINAFVTEPDITGLSAMSILTDDVFAGRLYPASYLIGKYAKATIKQIEPLQSVEQTFHTKSFLENFQMRDYACVSEIVLGRTTSISWTAPLIRLRREVTRLAKELIAYSRNIPELTIPWGKRENDFPNRDYNSSSPLKGIKVLYIMRPQSDRELHTKSAAALVAEVKKRGAEVTMCCDWGEIMASPSILWMQQNDNFNSGPFVNRKESLYSRGGLASSTEHRSLSAVIRQFASSHIIMGMHGAGLANAFFARPGSIIVEMFSNFALGKPSFMMLADGALQVHVAVSLHRNKSSFAEPINFAKRVKSVEIASGKTVLRSKSGIVRPQTSATTSTPGSAMLSPYSISNAPNNGGTPPSLPQQVVLKGLEFSRPGSSSSSNNNQWNRAPPINQRIPAAAYPQLGLNNENYYDMRPGVVNSWTQSSASQTNRPPAMKSATSVWLMPPKHVNRAAFPKAFSIDNRNRVVNVQSRQLQQSIEQSPPSDRQHVQRNIYVNQRLANQRQIVNVQARTEAQLQSNSFSVSYPTDTSRNMASLPSALKKPVVRSNVTRLPPISLVDGAVSLISDGLETACRLTFSGAGVPVISVVTECLSISQTGADTLLSEDPLSQKCDSAAASPASNDCLAPEHSLQLVAGPMFFHAPLSLQVAELSVSTGTRPTEDLSECSRDSKLRKSYREAVHTARKARSVTLKIPDQKMWRKKPEPYNSSQANPLRIRYKEHMIDAFGPSHDTAENICRSTYPYNWYNVFDSSDGERKYQPLNGGDDNKFCGISPL
jgi:hypothetical protein